MLSGNRNGIRRTARALLTLMAGAWLLAAAAPCAMAAPMPIPADHAGCCPDKATPLADCEALMALDCQQPQPTPPSMSIDVPVSMPVLLYTLPLALDPPLPQDIPLHARTDSAPPPPLLDRKQSRLLI